jgi:multidrug efflux pump subunit AcrA (membrane-fusion protein)
LRPIAIVILFGLFFIACKKKVETTRPVQERISESVYASGIIKSKNQYQVYAAVSGLVQTILVKAGDVVKKGDPLVVVQHEPSKLNAENARLAADYANANMGGDRLQALKSTIETAKSKMLNDSILLLRQQGLWAQQIGSKVELEQRELAYTSSKNSYQAALLNYRDLQQQLRFAAAQSQKLLSISKTLSEDYIIRSQTNGRIYSVNIEVGEIVSPQIPVATIGDADNFITELQIDENDIARITTGQRILMTMDSYKGQVFEATVTTIDPMINERTRTFTIESEFSKKPPVIYPNLTVEANIIMKFKDQAITIPRAYLISDSMVMLANKRTRKVTTGLKDYQKVEIINGLDTTETILKPAQ